MSRTFRPRLLVTTALLLSSSIIGLAVSDAARGGLPIPPLGAPPKAKFKVVCADLRCNFTDQSTDADGSVTGWAWSFGDSMTSSARNPAHAYALAGTYTVSLTVRDNLLNTNSTSAEITVTAPRPQNQPPRASFTQECIDTTCEFENRSSDSDGTIEATSWNFGDGSTSAGANPRHNFSDSGQYAVTLQVTDDDGGRSSVVKQLTVSEPDPRSHTAKLRNRKAHSGRAAKPGSWKYFSIRLPRHQKLLQVRLSGCGKNCAAGLDLYLRRGKHPNLRVFDCASRKQGSREICRVKRPARGSWKLGVQTESGKAQTRFRIRAKFR